MIISSILFFFFFSVYFYLYFNVLYDKNTLLFKIKDLTIVFSADIPLSGLFVWKHNITVSYSGDDNYLGFPISKIVDVAKTYKKGHFQGLKRKLKSTLSL